MLMKKIFITLSLLTFILQISFAQFVSWPENKQMALSLSFDDGRPSQVDNGAPLFDQYGAKVTFYVVPAAIQPHLEKWKKAVAAGHEIGNHSVKHPCSGNFVWARKKAIEEYSLEQIRLELIEANTKIKEMLSTEATSFAYPCGQTYVGRGEATQSYAPVVADLFVSGRGWMDEAPNDPTYVDMAQLTGVPMDNKDFEELLPMLEAARGQGLWLVLGGHDIGDEESGQTTRLSMLEKLIQYAQDPANGIWLAPVGEVADYVEKQRQD
jgi:peptidoglycan/xylan/chitin deacetylase (PgdA/CDA1 family)